MLGSAHGMRYGPRGTLPTIAGDLSANTLQMVAAALGLGAVIARSATAFTAIKWAGVAYLVWMGVSHFREDGESPTRATSPSHKTPWMRYSQGFITSASNPKAIVFFAALFPQFIDTTATSMPLALQFALLGVAFLVIDGSSVLLYAATAGRLSAWLTERGRLTTQRRITGSVLVGAAVLLSLKDAPASE